MKNEIVNYSATALSWWLMAIQIDDVIRYINLGLSIFLTCLSIGVSIYNIVRGVRETGKIDKNEVNSIVEHVNGFKEQMEGGKKDEPKGED